MSSKLKKKILFKYFEIYMKDLESAEIKKTQIFDFVIIIFLELLSFLYSKWPSLQNVADSTNAVGWSLILPSVRSVCVGRRRIRASATSVGQQRKY